MEKSAEAFRTISEVAELLDTPAHVLRFWESRFSQVKPVKRAGGRRYYRPSDLALLGGIKKLLHEDGMTIRGVQKILRESGIRHVVDMSIVDISQLGPSNESSEPTAKREDRTKPDKQPPATKNRLEDIVKEAIATPEPAQTDWIAEPGGQSHWPVSPSPDTAATGDDLLPDPDDETTETREEDVPEAPMLVDAPLLSDVAEDNVMPIGTHARPASRTDDNPDTAPPHQPAAALVRAMDALRAREKRGELRSVYSRLDDLRQRVAKENTKPLD